MHKLLLNSADLRVKGTFPTGDPSYLCVFKRLADGIYESNYLLWRGSVSFSSLMYFWVVVLVGQCLAGVKLYAEVMFVADTLQSLVGQQNARHGVVKVFNALQERKANKHLLYVSN